MRILFITLVYAFLLCFAAITNVNAKTHKRYALLIGNKNYHLKKLSLKNPHNDVKHIAKALKQLGFEVRTVYDAGYGKLQKETKRFASRLRKAGDDAVGFFYYSGHGAMDQKSRINYLIPVDISDTSTFVLWDDSVQLSEITRKLRKHASNATHFVIFDACRNELRLEAPNTKALLQSKGFKPEEGVIPGMLISYATAPGNTASDVGEKTGPYARVLAEEIVKPGIEVTSMFRKVQIKLAKAIGQEPWVTHTALPELYLAGRELPDALAWQAVEATQKISLLEAYIKKFPKSLYAPMARFRIKELQKQSQSQVELKAWETVKYSRNQILLEAFTRKYPNSIYAELAADLVVGLNQNKSNSGNYKLAAKSWELIRNSKSKEVFRKYIKRFSNTPYSNIARGRIEQIKKEELALLKLQQEQEEKNKENSAKPPQNIELKPNAAQKEKEEAEESIRELTKQLQTQLARVGCNPGSIDGAWGGRGRAALTQFNKNTGLKLDLVTPTKKAVQAISRKKGRICTGKEGDTTISTKGGIAGNWRVTYRHTAGCVTPEGTSVLKINSSGTITGGTNGHARGKVLPNGSFSFTRPCKYHSCLILFNGFIKGNSGKGHFKTNQGACYGRFKVSKM